MVPSKEFDELFQEMQHIERSKEARRKSLLTLQQKLDKKKHHIAPIFISIVMASVVFFLVFTLINQNSSPANNLAVGIADEDKNKAAIRYVLETEFTGPDEEYLVILEELHRQQTDPSYEGYVGNDKPHNPEKLITYVKKTYSSYFTESGLDGFTNSTPAFAYHWLEIDYRMSINDIEVVQSKNSSAPKNYSFTGQVQYVDKDGETSQFEISGNAICSELGKIGRITITGTELMDQLREDYN